MVTNRGVLYQYDRMVQAIRHSASLICIDDPAGVELELGCIQGYHQRASLAEQYFHVMLRRN